MYGKFLDVAQSIQIDNPILFNDTPKALISQFLKIVKFPQDQLLQASFPFSYWNLWWGIFYLSGDTAPITAFTTTLSNYINQKNPKESPLLELAIQQLTTNAYQHSLVYSTISRLRDTNSNCSWISSIIEDVDKINEKYGAFTLSMYEREKPIIIPSSGRNLLLEHLPNIQVSITPILPPFPYVVSNDKLQETIKFAS